jgi:hypothetical protein
MKGRHEYTVKTLNLEMTMYRKNNASSIRKTPIATVENPPDFSRKTITKYIS